MTALLDALRGRARQREMNALDLVAEAARAAAAGKTYDPAAVEMALRDQGLTLADFETAIANARQRAVWLQHFDGLNAAASRGAKLQAAITQEEEKLEQQRLAARAKIGKLAAELDAENAAIHAGETARHELLKPDRVPGTIGIRYREHVASRDKLNEARSEVSRDLRDARSRLETHRSLAEQTITEGRKRVECDVTLAQRAAKLDDYNTRAKSAARYVKEIETKLAAIDKELATVEAAIKRMEIEVLKA